MKILFATDYKNIAKEIAKLYKKTYKVSLQFDVSHTKKETFKMLKENLYDVVVLKSSLDSQAVLFSELEYIIKLNDKQRFIYLIDETCNDNNITQLLYEIKSNDGLLEKDATNINITTLINKGRSKLEAKSYYNASDEINLINTSDYEPVEQRELMIMLEKISKLSSTIEIVEYLEKLENIFDKEQLVYFYSKLTLDIRSKLVGNDLYEKHTTYSSVEEEVEALDEIYDIPDDDYDEQESNVSQEQSYVAQEESQELDEIYDIPDDEEESEQTTTQPSQNQEQDNNSVNETQINETQQETVNEKESKTNITKPKVEEPKVVERIVEVEKVVEVEKLIQVEKIIEVEKLVEVEKLIEVEKVVEKIVQVEKNIVNRVVIGVMGVKSGIGTTYHALSLAKTLSQSYKVAIVEFKNDFTDIGEAYEVEINNNMFTLDGVDYFSVDIEYFYRNQLDRDYNYIIVDFGAYSPELIKDYYRTNIRLMVCGSQPWEDKYLGHFLTEQQSISNVKYIFNLTNHNKDIVENMPGLQVYFAPYFNSVDMVENLYKDIVNDIEVTGSKPVEVETKKKGFIPNFLRRG